MSISKRSLIFVFAIAVLLFFAHDREAVAQNYKGMDMPDVFYLTQKPFAARSGPA